MIFSNHSCDPTRYLRRMVRRGDPGQNWLAFLQNHREVIAAFDLFTVPTVTFQVLYCWFVIEHERRKMHDEEIHAATIRVRARFREDILRRFRAELRAPASQMSG